MNYKGVKIMSKDVTVKVTHVGEDYGKVEVQVKGFNADEFEVPKALALALKAVLA